MMSLLEAKDVYVHYNTARGVVKAVDGISFNVNSGEALGLVGESGSGKTSLALSLMRVYPPNTGLRKSSLVFNGSDLSKMSDDDFRSTVRWRKISMVFQGAMNSLNPVTKVGHQVAEPLIVGGSVSKDQAYSKAASLLKAIGVAPEFFNRYPHELSGGLKQRVALAMSLVMDPQLVIMDEPTSALDVSIQAQIMNLIKRLKKELSLSIIFITHDIALASDICDSISVMYAGQIIEAGRAEEILSDPKHPYTQKLMASAPKLKGDSKPEFIPGTPPELIDPSKECRFRPRCEYAFEPCGEMPPMIKIGERQHARCWLYKQ